jgi:hypothetical protein
MAAFALPDRSAHPALAERIAMPTASKLAGAFAFAVLSFFAAQSFIPHLPEGSVIGMFREITTAIGLAVGWFVMGRLTGHGYLDAIGSGMRTQLTVVFWALLGFSIYFMVKKSTHMMYDGPMEAVIGVFDIMLDYGKKLLVPDMAAILLGGGALAGILTEWAGKRWS